MSTDTTSSWSRNTPLGSGSTDPRLKTQSRKSSTYVAPGCSVRGELRFEGHSEFDAILDGDIFSTGELVIGESAEISGDINGEAVRVFGRVAGDIVCSGRLELNAGARVTGSITSPRLVIHDGVVFEGDCRMPEGGLEASGGDSFSQDESGVIHLGESPSKTVNR